MPLSPPTKVTMVTALVLTVVGLIVGLVGLFDLLPPDLIPIAMNTNELLYYCGFLIPAIGWILIFIGTRVKGM
jgi:hypothetical protein